jgi:multidrug efflux pump subunit AcrA (membrane-fusion protein)
MKKIILLTTLSIALLACSTKESDASLEQLISDKNVAALQTKKATLQAELAKIEDALAVLDVKKIEALVAIQTLKDTVFNHYLEVQGSVDTKENIVVQPEFSGTLTALYVKAGQRVTKGQILGKIDDELLCELAVSVGERIVLKAV